MSQKKRFHQAFVLSRRSPAETSPLARIGREWRIIPRQESNTGNLIDVAARDNGEARVPLSIEVTLGSILDEPITASADAQLALSEEAFSLEMRTETEQSDSMISCPYLRTFPSRGQKLAGKTVISITAGLLYSVIS